MLFQHECDTCSAKGNCELEKVFIACREAYTVSLDNLITLVKNNMASISDPQQSYQWLAAGIEVITLFKKDDLIRFANTIRDTIPEEKKEILEAMYVSLSMSISDSILQKSERLIKAMASLFVPKADLSSISMFDPANKPASDEAPPMPQYNAKKGTLH